MKKSVIRAEFLESVDVYKDGKSFSSETRVRSDAHVIEPFADGGVRVRGKAREGVDQATVPWAEVPAANVRVRYVVEGPDGK